MCRFSDVLVPYMAPVRSGLSNTWQGLIMALGLHEISKTEGY